MRVFTFFISILLLLVQPLMAETDTIYIDSPGIVGGTWTPEHRYIARWDVTVPYDSVLTIQPGVNIEIQDGFTFKVEGQLNANGNTNNPIHFMPYGSFWDGITFGTPSGQPTSRTSFLSHAHIDCGDLSENTEAVVIGKHTVQSLNNLNLSNASNGVRVTGFALIDNISQCVFENVRQAISYEYCDFISDVLIQNCDFIGITDRAIHVAQNQAYLENVEISGCDFNNSALAGNISESAIYITLNEQLSTITLASNSFHSFGYKDGTISSVFISDNIILEEVVLEMNGMSSCGGATPANPKAMYGGVYVNRSERVIMDRNEFADNTGLRSGAAYLDADQISFTQNVFSNNRNNYIIAGQENFGGALTLVAGQRIAMNGDAFLNNYSRKSGGAMSIIPLSDEILLNLIFDDLTLSSNSSENEGGAVLVSGALDTLSISNSSISDNFSISGSGGCFSVITEKYNVLSIENNAIQENFVSATSDGGFLYLRHNPLNVPEYGTFSLLNNEHVFNDHLDRNYNLVYMITKSFPSEITISANQANDCYPVSGHLYHFELLEDGPEPQAQQVDVEVSDNSYIGNRCPIFYFSNEFASVTSHFSGNTVEGSGSAFGTFLNVHCNEVYAASFADEHYTGLISGNSGGGAVSFSALKEIGALTIDACISENCFSVESNGGHFSFVSGASDTVMEQSVMIMDSYFDNDGITEFTGGDGGAIYYHTPGAIDSLLIRNCEFSSLRSGESGGALYVNARELASVDILGSHFTGNIAADTAGAVYLNAFNGNIPVLNLLPFNEIPTRFDDCQADYDGGAMCVKAQKEIGKVTIESLESFDCVANEGNGGHLFMASFNSDASVKQNLSITNSTFTVTGNGTSGGKGGAVYYFAENGDVDSIMVYSSTFSGLKAYGSGGAFYARAKELGKVNFTGSVFEADRSLEGAGGAVYVQAFSGSIDDFSLSPYGDVNTQFTGCNSGSDGGAVYVESFKEIGRIEVIDLESKKCHSVEGYGGHLAFFSNGTDEALAQEIHIQGSIFDNTGLESLTGGNGGAVFYTTPGSLNQFDLQSGEFINLKASGLAGAICVLAREVGEASILGSNFENTFSTDTAGAVYMQAFNGNIASFNLAPLNNTVTSFFNCHAGFDGGAVYLRASREIGLVEIDSVTMENCFSSQGNGGFMALISSGADPSLSQHLNVTDSYFENGSLSGLAAQSGGIFYYDAFSDLASLTVSSSGFSGSDVMKDGGSICAKAARIDELLIGNNIFGASVAQVLSGGALYVKTSNGLFDAELQNNSFLNCKSGSMGGAVYLEDGKFDNAVEDVRFRENVFRMVTPGGMPESGGAVYAKGYNRISFNADSVISHSASDKGGFAYFEKVFGLTLDSLYTYNNSAAHGGVMYYNGDAGATALQTIGVYSSSFLFNTAETTAGCFYIINADSVEIGQADKKNNFVANQSLSPASNNDQVGGGVFYIHAAENLSIGNNSFYVNTSQNYGGIGIISQVGGSMNIAGNNFLNNQANAGGAFFFNNAFGNGVIEWNNFSFNTSSEQAGALLFSPGSSNSIRISDNTFFKNNTGKWGGALTAYRPVTLVRNLFRENHLVDLNPTLPHKGTTLYLSGGGNQSMIKNCVFDQNYYEPYDTVASIYFDTPEAVFPDYNISNCSFFNFSDEHYSVYNNVNQGTVVIQNSIFTQRQNVSRDEAVVYFNDGVSSRYSDLIYSQIHDTINHNYDEYVYFNLGDYYFDSSQYPVDKGDPDPAFNDFHLPPAYPTLRNDLGVSGGPDNPDTNGVFIFEEPANLPNNFDLVVTRNCFTFNFKCMGEYVDTYESFYWFMPDAIIKTDEPELEYTFSCDLSGNHIITALGHDEDNADAYGFGQYNANLDIIRILDMRVEVDDDTIPVPAVPFTVSIAVETEVENDTPYNWSWAIPQSNGVEFSPITSENGMLIEISKMTAQQGFIRVEYTLSACECRTLTETVDIYLKAGPQWGYPIITYFPVSDNIIDSTSFFTVTFDKVMLKQDGGQISNAEIDDYIEFTKPTCQDLEFRKSVTYTTSSTIFTYQQYDPNTQQKGILCNGEYKFDVISGKLFTQFYKLKPVSDTVKSYTVCCNDIDEGENGRAVKLFPNPFHDKVHLQIDAPGEYRFEICNLQGKVEKAGNILGRNEVTLNLASLSDGFYILILYKEGDIDRKYMKINKITH